MGEIFNIAVALFILTLVGIGFGYFLLRFQGGEATE
jgi:F0F1-type ATP synthase assembly protein I